MNEEAKWAFISALDDELLKGGATMSEWCAFIVRDCDFAFVAGANLATVISASATIETYLHTDVVGVFQSLPRIAYSVGKQKPQAGAEINANRPDQR